MKTVAEVLITYTDGSREIVKNCKNVELFGKIKLFENLRKKVVRLYK